MLQDKNLSAREISNDFNISKPSISHHLNVLKQADLIRGERIGPFIHYSINITVLEEAANGLLEMINQKKERGKYLNTS